MPDLESRLERCFSSVFPGSTIEEIRAGGAEDGTWDSLSLVTLVAVVQEEFEIDIPEEEVPALNSFTAFRRYIRAAGGGS